MSQTPTVQPPVLMVDGDRACVGCGYNLRGLPVNGLCPECATSVEHTLRGFLLRFASARYLESLHQGLVLALVGLMGQVVVSVGAIATTAVVFLLGFNTTGAGPSPATFQLINLVFGGLGLLAYLGQCVGLWKFTQPDPGFAGSEQPNSARRVVRAMIVVLAISETMRFGFQTFGGAPGVGSVGVFSMAAAGVALLAWVAKLVCWVVQFFAMMLYVGWLARRMPDEALLRRTKLYMWLLPVLWTVGWIVFWLGPLAALVLYWLMLNSIRRYVFAVRKRPAFGPGPAPA